MDAAPSLPEKMGSRSSCLLCIYLVAIHSHLNCLIKESRSMDPKRNKEFLGVKYKKLRYKSFKSASLWGSEVTHDDEWKYTFILP